MSVRWSGRVAAQSAGGNVRRPGGGAADQAQGLGEGDPVGVQVGGGGRLRDERADRVVDDQVGPDLLVNQLGQPGAEDLPGAAEVGFELVVTGFLFPSFVVGDGQFVARAWPGSRIVVISTISSPVRLSARSGTVYSMTRTSRASGQPRSSVASGGRSGRRRCSRRPRSIRGGRRGSWSP